MSIERPTRPSEEQKPDYNYDQNGLRMSVYDIKPQTAEARQVTITDIPHADYEHESFARVMNAVGEGRNEGGIGFTLIPPAAGETDSGKVMKYDYPWSGHTNNPVGQNEMAALAAANPDTTILAIDNPSTGFSDRIPASVSREIGKTGSYMPYAELAVDALEHVLKSFDKHVLAGSSQGARREIAFAAVMGYALELSTEDLRLIDPVGSHDQSLLKLAKGFMIDMAGNSGRYVEASTDGLGAAAQKQQDSPKRAVAGIKELIERRGSASQFLREPQALAQGGLKDDLLKALPYVGRLEVTTPDMSELTRVENIHGILEEIAALKAGPEEIQHRVLHDQTHAMYAGHPGALGVLLSDQYR